LLDLVWSPEALADTLDIAGHYLSIDPAIAVAMLDRVEDAPVILREFPHLGSPTRLPGVRKWRVDGTPYILLYAVAPSTVDIRRVVHTASDWHSLL